MSREPLLGDNLATGAEMHDELACITDGAAMWDAILADAELLAAAAPPVEQGDPADELRIRFPAILATLSPAARALIRDHCAHTTEIVAFVHSMLPIVHHVTHR